MIDFRWKGWVEMDKKIQANIKKTKSLLKDEKSLLKADRKRDKICTMGKKMMKAKKDSHGR